MATEDSKNSEHSKNSAKTLLFAGLGILALAVVFWAGAMVQDRNKPHTFLGGKLLQRGFGAREFHHQGGFFSDENSIAVTGKITNVNGKDFTIDQNGSTKTVKTDDDTHFGGVGISGLKSGDEVSVVGTTNSDGSIQAKKVMVKDSSASSKTSNPAT